MMKEIVLFSLCLSICACTPSNQKSEKDKKTHVVKSTKKNAQQALDTSNTTQSKSLNTAKGQLNTPSQAAQSTAKQVSTDTKPAHPITTTTASNQANQANPNQANQADQVNQAKSKLPKKRKKKKIKKRKEGLMKVTLGNIGTDQVLPSKYAFCKSNKKGGSKWSRNVNPKVMWSNVPPNTKSFALIMHDSKAPMKREHVNQKDKTIAKSMPRVSFFHWILVNIPASMDHIAQGADSKGVVKKGKSATQQPYGLRGLNSYSYWFNQDKKMQGKYAGYDGPCPPWNDEVVHEYYFTVYALDVERLSLPKNFSAPQVFRAMKGHVLTQAHAMAKYKTNTNIEY